MARPSRESRRKNPTLVHGVFAPTFDGRRELEILHAAGDVTALVDKGLAVVADMHAHGWADEHVAEAEHLLADGLVRAGRQPEAVDHLEVALDITAEPDRRLVFLRLLTTWSRQLARDLQVEEHARALLESPERADRSRALTALAGVALLRDGDLGRALALSDGALELRGGDAVEDDALRRRGLFGRALILVEAERWLEADAAVAALLAHPRRPAGVGDLSHVRAAGLDAVLHATTAAHVGDLPRAQAAIDEAWRLLADAPDEVQAELLFATAQVEQIGGADEAADRHLQDAMARATSDTSAWTRAKVSRQVARVAASRGDRASADAWYAHAVAILHHLDRSRLAYELDAERRAD